MISALVYWQISCRLKNLAALRGSFIFAISQIGFELVNLVIPFVNLDFVGVDDLSLILNNYQFFLYYELQIILFHHDFIVFFLESLHSQKVIVFGLLLVIEFLLVILQLQKKKMN